MKLIQKKTVGRKLSRNNTGSYSSNKGPESTDWKDLLSAQQWWTKYIIATCKKANCKTINLKVYRFKKKIYQGLWIWVVMESLTTLKTRKQWSTTVQHSEGSLQPRVRYQTEPWIVCKDRWKPFHHKQGLKNTPYAPPFFRKLNKVSATPKRENKQSEGPRVQEWRDRTQKHEAGLESKRLWRKGSPGQQQWHHYRNG